MADELSRALLLRIRIAMQDAKRAQGEIKNIQRELETYVTTEKKLAQGALANANITQQQAKNFQTLSKSLKDVKKDMDEVGKSAQQTATLVDRVKPEVEAFRREGEIQGFATQSLRTAALGGGGAVGAGAVQIFDIIDSLPKIPLALTIVRDSLVSNIQAISSGLTAIGPAGIAAGAALAALGVAFAGFIQEQQRRAEDLGNFIRRQQELELDIAVGGKTREQLEAELTRAQTEYQVKQRQFLDAVAAYESNLDSARQAVGVFAGLGEVVARAVDPLEEELGRIVEENRTAAVAAADNIAVLNAALNNNATASNDAAVAAQKAAEEEQKRLQSNEQALARLASLQDQANVALERYNQTLRETAESRGIRDARAEEDEQERRQNSAQRHQETLTRIAQDGQSRIENINKQISELASATTASILDARQKGAEAEQALTSDYFTQNIKAAEKFRQEELKRASDANKQRLRDLQDLNDRLNDAARQNDVVAFLQAQREGEKRLQRTAEDLDEETQQRGAAFASEQAERRQAFEARLSEIRKGTEQEIAEIQRGAAERRAALAQSIEDEKTAIRERLKAQTEAFATAEAEQEAQRQKRLKRQEEDDARADRKQQEALQRQLADIDAKGAAELRAIQQTVGATAELERMAMRLKAIVESTKFPPAIPVQTRPGQNALPGTGGGGNSLWNRLLGGTAFSFAQGGIAMRPTLAVIGDRPGGEAVVPLSGGRGFGPNITIVMNNTIGDVASRREVEAGLAQYNAQLEAGLVNTFARMLN